MALLVTLLQRHEGDLHYYCWNDDRRHCRISNTEEQIDNAADVMNNMQQDLSGPL
jgi:hypothetical protein